MTDDVAYSIVQHDGGWAYKLGDVFSETFQTKEDAASAAETAASEQRVPGETEAISWEDDQGVWHDEVAEGSDRPDAHISKD